MPAKKTSFIEQHFEKAVAGVAGLVLLFCVARSMLGSPVTVEIEGQILKPGEAYAFVAEQAKRLDERASAQKIPEFKQEEKPATPGSVLKLEGLPEDMMALGAIVPMSVEKETTTARRSAYSTYDLPKVLPPQRLAVYTGRSTLEVGRDDQWTENVGEETIDLSWVTVAAEIDHEEQKKLLEGLPDVQGGVGPYFVRVDLQRAEIDEYGRTGDWEDVKPFDSRTLLLDPQKPLKMDVYQEFKVLREDLISAPDAVQADALNPDFPVVVAGTDWDIPKVKGEKDKPKPADTPRARTRVRTPKRRDRTAPGPGASKPRRGGAGPPGLGPRPGVGGGFGGGPGRPGAFGMPLGPGIGMPGGFPGPGLGMRGPMMGRGARTRKPSRRTGGKSQIELTDKELLRVWAQDMTAKEGGTYKYSMRVVMYNPLAGWTLYLKNKEDTLLVGLASEWTEPTAPVTLGRETYFFLRSAKADKKEAVVEVYKWKLGWLCKATFRIQPGQEIGTPKRTRFYVKEGDSLIEEQKLVDFDTGAVLVDVESPRSMLVAKAVRGEKGQFQIFTDDKVAAIVYRDAQGRLKRQTTTMVPGSPDDRSAREMTSSQGKIYKSHKKNKTIVKRKDLKEGR